MKVGLGFSSVPKFISTNSEMVFCVPSSNSFGAFLAVTMKFSTSGSSETARQATLGT